MGHPFVILSEAVPPPVILSGAGEAASSFVILSGVSEAASQSVILSGAGKAMSSFVILSGVSEANVVEGSRALPVNPGRRAEPEILRLASLAQDDMVGAALAQDEMVGAALAQDGRMERLA